MLTFAYVARDPKTGKKIEAVMEAENESAVSKSLKDQGLAPIEITMKSGGGNIFQRYKNRVNAKDKILFSRQLSTLVNAGLPLIQSLRSVAGQTTSKPFKVIINRIIGDIEGGASLSLAMSRHPTIFNQIFISLVEAGETSGTLDKSLERLANQQEKDAELISKVRGAMVYPIIVMVVMLVVLTFMIVKVLPQVEELYKGLPGAKLPLVTQILLAIAKFVIKDWWVVLIIIGALIFFSSRWLRTLGGKRLADKIKMRMPAIGPLFMKMYMARFARTGTTLVASGVPLLQVLDITARSINNVYIEDSLKEAIEKVKGGKALSEAIADDPNFLELVPNMLRIGEQSGAVEAMLGKTADYYEKEVDTQIKTVSTIIEPVLMVVMGVVAFIIVAAVLLPIYGLAGQTIVK